MKNIPNYITVVRLIAAFAIIGSCFVFADKGMHLFLPLFVAAGVSDMLDGFVARKFNWCTEFGARLDSISDLTLYLSVLLFLNIHFSHTMAMCQSVLLLGLFVQAAHLIIAFCRFGQFPAYHTKFSRFCAYFIFFGLLTFLTLKTPLIIASLAAVWIVCSIEGIIITCLLKRQLNNLSGITAVFEANSLLA